MRKEKDIKFIIYQSLYIFLICVVAIKGANIDLVEVEERRMKGESIIEIDTLDKVVLDKKEYSGLIKLKPDEIVVTKAEYDRNTASYVPVTSSTTPLVTQNTPDIIKQPEPQVTDPNITKSVNEIKINISDYANKLNLTQYTSITVNNPFDAYMDFAGKTIAPKSTASITLGGESTLIMKVGSSSATIGVKPNQKPQINFQKMTSMGANTRVTVLQRTVCYRVTISDDFPDQLDVKFSGPVIVKEVGKKVYDITMNAFNSKTAFDDFTSNKNDPYSLGFNVIVTDKIAGHKQTGQQQFIFDEW